MNQALNLNTLREKVFFYCLLSVVVFFPFSEALVSITAVILLVQAIALSSWKHPSVNCKDYVSLLLVVSVFAVYLVGMIFTKDVSFALYELRKVIFWILLPLAFFISPRISKEQFLKVLLLFCMAVFLSSMTGMIKLSFKDYFQITDFRDVIPVSHIRFSFQIILSIIIITYLLVARESLPGIDNKRLIPLLFLAWFIYFLFLLKSITGIVAFIGTAFLAFTFFVTKIKRRSKKIILILTPALILAIPVSYVTWVWIDFYNVEILDPQKVDRFTASGNPYTFDFNSKEKENGHWVRAYICEDELRKEWNTKSPFKYDSIDPYGYPYSATLIRYMTGKGLRKDSAGVHMLTPDDIKAVEGSVANHIFEDRTFSIYPRVYETIWELDTYFRTDDPNNQSVSQRIEYVKASLLLIGKNPLFGVGTGNWKIKYGEAYREMNSKLIPENQGPSHNQYLNYLVKFGIVGFLFIFSVLLIPVFREGHRRNPVFWMFLISIAIANFGDANLETHMGLSFFCFFYCLFLWNSPRELRDFHL
jgi:hypothetical protein